MSDQKEQALQTIVNLAQEHDITAEEIGARLIKDSTKTKKAGNVLIMRIMTYIGALFVFSGLASLVGLIWDDLGSAARVIVTFGPGLVALLLALAAFKDERYVKAVTPLLLIAAFLQPAGLFVFLNEYFTGNDAALAAMIVFGPMALQMLALFKAMKQASPLFFTLFFGFGFFWAAMDKTGIDGDLACTVIGISGLLISHAVNKTPYRAFVPLTYFIFALMTAGGAFALVHEIPPLDFLLIGLAAFMVYASVIAQSRSFLVASVITMLGYLGYYTNEYFADMLSWPLALIIMGLLMLGVSSYAVKLGQRIGQND